MTDDKNSLVERMHKWQMQEVRDELRETQEALEASQDEVERLELEIKTKQSVMDMKIKKAEQQIALIAEKDEKIKMLTQRVDNVNKEFNKMWGGSAKNKTSKPQDPNRATTLADVYKLTGEGGSPDVR